MIPVVKVTTHGRRVLSVDPGIRGCGAALFDGARLVSAAYVKSAAKSGNRAEASLEMALAVSTWHYRETHGAGVDELVVEWPQVYTAGKGKGDPNDLLALCGVDGAVAALVEASSVTSYLPAEWKGQLKKEAHHLRIENRLSESEVKILDIVRRDAGAKAHNAIDAIGLGLHHLGRLERKRVVAF